MRRPEVGLRQDEDRLLTRHRIALCGRAGWIARKNMAEQVKGTVAALDCSRAARSALRHKYFCPWKYLHKQIFLSMEIFVLLLTLHVSLGHDISSREAGQKRVPGPRRGVGGLSMPPSWQGWTGSDAHGEAAAVRARMQARGQHNLNARPIRTQQARAAPARPQAR